MAEVFDHHLGMKLLPCRSRPKQSGYTAHIPFSAEETGDAVATVWIQRATLKKVSQILLFESDPDEETLEDLTAELANFIVGHAKMLASDRNLPCQMKTPEFVGIMPLQKSGKTLLYKAENRCVALQIKGDHA